MKTRIDNVRSIPEQNLACNPVVAGEIIPFDHRIHSGPWLEADAVAFQWRGTEPVRVTTEQLSALTAVSSGFTSSEAANFRGVAPQGLGWDLKEGVKALRSRNTTEASAKALTLGLIPVRPAARRIRLAHKHLHGLALRTLGYKPKEVAGILGQGFYETHRMFGHMREQTNSIQDPELVFSYFELGKFVVAASIDPSVPSPRVMLMRSGIDFPPPQVKSRTRIGQIHNILRYLRDPEYYVSPFGLDFKELRMMSDRANGLTTEEINEAWGLREWSRKQINASILRKAEAENMPHAIAKMSGVNLTKWEGAPDVDLTFEEVVIIEMLAKGLSNVHAASEMVSWGLGMPSDDELARMRRELFVKLGAKTEEQAVWQALNGTEAIASFEEWW